jgi:hypothetical protein
MVGTGYCGLGASFVQLGGALWRIKQRKRSLNYPPRPSRPGWRLDGRIWENTARYQVVDRSFRNAEFAG